jgi:hypothetical protein
MLSTSSTPPSRLNLDLRLVPAEVLLRVSLHLFHLPNALALSFVRLFSKIE